MLGRWFPFPFGDRSPGAVTWFGAGLSVAALGFVAYALLLAPPPTVATALPPRPEETLTPTPSGAPRALPTQMLAVAAGVATAQSIVSDLAAPPARATATPYQRPSSTATSTPLMVVVGCPSGVRVNLNTASVSDLQALPGIGPAAAQRIVEQRQQSRFTSVDDLQQLHLVSRLTFGRVRDLVTVGADP
jgi:competence ComEA-like helix-hairpin-helix protein